MDKPIIENHGLTKSFGTVAAVSDVSMTVRRGEVYGFLGPNGAGKTTTLRMLLGLARPTSGTAIVAGHAPGDPAGLAKIGALVDSAAFYPYLSGRENLHVVADLAGISHSGADPVLDEVDLLPPAHRKFSGYSPALKHHLGVAAAPLKNPERLLRHGPPKGP